MQHEGISIRTKLGNNEWRPLRHQAGDEVNIAAQAIQLGHDDRAFGLAGGGECRRELGASVEGIRTLAGLDLDELSHDLEPIVCGEPGVRFPLRLNAQAGLALLLGGDSEIGDNGVHGRLPSLC